VTDDDLRQRLDRLEGRVQLALDNGRFVRTDRFDEYQRSQEKVDLAQETRFAEVNERVDEIRDGQQWLQRQLIILLFFIVGTATIAALAMRAAS
jgi:hypothetical protein